MVKICIVTKESIFSTVSVKSVHMHKGKIQLTINIINEFVFMDLKDLAIYIILVIDPIK